MSREKNLAINTIVLSIGTFIPKILTIIILPIITGRLTKSELGTYDLIITSVSLALPIVTLQIHSAAFRFLIDCRDDDIKKRRIITNLFCFVLPISFIAISIIFVIIDQFAYITRFLICLYFFVDIIQLLLFQIVRGLSNNKLYSFAAVIQSIIHFFSIIILIYYLNLGLNGVLFSITISIFISCAFLFFKSDIFKYFDIKLIEKTTLTQMILYSWPMIPNTLSAWVLDFSDRAVLTAFIGIEYTAIYAVANKIPGIFNSVQGTFIFAWQENASLARNDEDASLYYTKMFDAIFRMVFGMMVMLISASPLIFKALIRGDYNEAFIHVPILLMAAFFSAVSSFLGGIYVAHKKTINVGVTTLTGAVINLIIDLILIRRIGIFAASISTLISYTFLALFRMKNIRRYQDIKYDYKIVIVCIICLISESFCCAYGSLMAHIMGLVVAINVSFILNKHVVARIIQRVKRTLIEIR